MTYQPEPHRRISDWSRCPLCVGEGVQVDGSGFASAYFNFANTLYAVCARHSVRWAVTRALSMSFIADLDEYPQLAEAFRTVEGNFESRGHNVDVFPKPPN